MVAPNVSFVSDVKPLRLLYSYRRTRVKPENMILTQNHLLILTRKKSFTFDSKGSVAFLKLILDFSLSLAKQAQCKLSEDCDQPGYPSRMISVFPVMSSLVIQ